jgi:hypothetical protein
MRDARIPNFLFCILPIWSAYSRQCQWILWVRAAHFYIAFSHATILLHRMQLKHVRIGQNSEKNPKSSASFDRFLHALILIQQLWQLYWIERSKLCSRHSKNWSELTVPCTTSEQSLLPKFMSCCILTNYHSFRCKEAKINYIGTNYNRLHWLKMN